MHVMKTCGYCGRENEDAAVVCRECGLSEFPEASKKNAPTVHAAAPVVAAVTEPEIPTPDVGSDQEAALCPFCLFPNLPDRGWCKQCGTPFNTSVLGPFEGALAEGFMWRSAVRGRPRLWVLLVIWVIFFPVFFAGALTAIVAVCLGTFLLAPIGGVYPQLGFP